MFIRRSSYFSFFISNHPMMMMMIRLMTALSSLFLIYLSVSCRISESFEFVYNGFNNSNLVQDGATTIKPSGALRLTHKVRNIIGHAFHPTPIPISNSSFATAFVFQILPSDENRGGYGFAFTLSLSPSFPNAEAKHFMGIFNSSNDGNSTNHVFLVEFDTVNGFQERSDTFGNHIGINLNGMRSVASDSASYFVNGTRRNEDIDLESGMQIQAWIEYDGPNKIVNVTVAPWLYPKPAIPLMSENIDLSQILRYNMYAGFSAATGEKFSSHYILGWSFKLNGTADPLNYESLPVAGDDDQKSTNSDEEVKTTLIITFAVLFFILLTALGGIFAYRRFLKSDQTEDWELDFPRRFRYRDLCEATKGFRRSEIVGIGGFGAVYRGVLAANGAEIAVKKITANNSLQGMREFVAEIESLGRLRHKNLVNLQGWCKHKGDLLLVYEFVPNGSLDSLLYRSSNGSLFLNWDQRFSIIKDITAGLLYLHEEWEKVVIHRDVKSSNVLIDLDMNAKLGDFGLARLYDHGKMSHTTNVVGTIGYIAPELTRTGKASTSTDVFAFGIVLLELACGRAPVACKMGCNEILVDWVVECMQLGSIFDVVDPRLGSEYAMEEMEIVLGLGLLCSHPKAERRPNMREVIKYLNRDQLLPVFDNISCIGSTRVDELTSRLLGLGLSTSAATGLHNSYSAREVVSCSSFESGR